MYRLSLAAVIVALTLAPSTGAAQAPAPDGAALYRQNCRSCHGLKGAAPQRMVTVYPKLPASIADTAYLRTRSVDSIAAVIRHGAGRDMKGFAERLSAEEVAAIAKFVKGLASDTTHAP